MANDEFGDFQTPDGLVREIFAVLDLESYGRVLEPTCGVGNFLRVAKELLPNAELKGVEIQEHYAKVAKQYADVVIGDAMQMNIGRQLSWRDSRRLLVVGNPPWVANAALTSLGSVNKPKIENIRGLKGLDALTGASNFDIAEAIILKLIADLDSESPTIALLCKTQVARNVLSFCEQFSLGVASSKLYEIDAKKWFNAGVDACLFVIELQPGARNYVADVFRSLQESVAVKSIGVIEGRLVSDVEKYVHTKAADGLSPVIWRQGIKHDGTQAMELVESDGPRRKSGETVDVESDFLYPLLKCTDVARGRTTALSKWMVVPQRHTGDDTARLQTVAPKLWDYLVENAALLDNRKSSIYRNRSRFCIFGVGEYSFSPFKVAISAMHKKPSFRLVAPIHGRPAVFDDVCYFTSFNSGANAAIVTAILMSRPAQDLLESLSFTDAKRPITKKLLQRLDLSVLAELTDADSLVDSATALSREAGLVIERAELDSAFSVLMREWGTSEPSLFALEPVNA